MSKILDLHDTNDIHEQIIRAEKSLSLCNSEKVIGYLKDCERFYGLINRVRGITTTLEYGGGDTRYINNLGLLEGLTSLELDDANNRLAVLGDYIDDYKIALECARKITKSPFYPMLGRVVVAEFDDGTVIRGKLLYEYSIIGHWGIRPIIKSNKLSKTVRYYNGLFSKIRLAEGDEAYYEEW